VSLQHERKLRMLLAEEGWLVIRAAKGIVDLVALQDGMQPRLIQVKHTRRAYDHFLPADRHALLAAAEIAGASAWLIWWPPVRGVGWKWIPSDQWPSR